MVAKLGDFGLVSAENADSTACTPRYASPEVLTQTGGPYQTPSDVYSLGN